jgi:hypothetical protein
MPGLDELPACPMCAGPITSVTTIIELTAEQVLGRDGPPTAIPHGAGFAFYIEPCGHPATLLQLREVGIEAEQFEP